MKKKKKKSDNIKTKELKKPLWSFTTIGIQFSHITNIFSLQIKFIFLTRLHNSKYRVSYFKLKIIYKSKNLNPYCPNLPLIF